MAFYKAAISIFCFLYSQMLWAVSVQETAYDIPYHQQMMIHVVEKKLSRSQPKHVVILLAPLSIPSLVAFDVPGYSLMDVLAKKGFDVWGVDFIGEGHASFPESMQVSPAPMGVFPLRAADATLQLKEVVNFISEKTKLSQVSLLGWSWGSVVAAMYSTVYPKDVTQLILYGSMYSATLPESMAAMNIKPFQQQLGVFNPHLPAYQNIPWQEVREHWMSMLQGRATIVSPEAIKAVAKIYRKIDSHPFQKDSLRRPMGPTEDLFFIWNQKPIYDIQKITVPTLVIYGDQDIFADHNLYNGLTHAQIKQLVVLHEATHWLIYEKSRPQFYKAVIDFLK